MAKQDDSQFYFSKQRKKITEDFLLSTRFNQPSVCIVASGKKNYYFLVRVV
jgi:hypothetical protein